MPELTEVDVNKQLLAEVEGILKGKNERLSNITARVKDLRAKLLQNVDGLRWVEAQDTLNQLNKLAVDRLGAEADVKQAEARVDTLKSAIKKAEEQARIAAMPKPYRPYVAEPINPAPVQAPPLPPVQPQVAVPPPAAPLDVTTDQQPM